MIRGQVTLTGDPARKVYERPDTFRWCAECDEWVLRSRFRPHLEHGEEGDGR